jgi:hypothetical protein
MFMFAPPVMSSMASKIKLRWSERRAFNSMVREPTPSNLTLAAVL